MSDAGHVDVTWLEDVGANREVFFTHPPEPNFKLLFIPLAGWTDDAFKAAVARQVDGLTRDLPVAACASLVEATVILPSEAAFTNFTCSETPMDCKLGTLRDFVRNVAHRDDSVYDVVVGLMRPQLRPCGRLVGCSNRVDTLWALDLNCHVLQHEVGHVFRLMDEYDSKPAGCESDACNDGGPAFGGDDVNFLGADEGCDPRAGMGCCNTCPKEYGPVCCQGNQDIRGGRSVMSYCEASNDQTWEARSLAHMTSRGEFGCNFVGTSETVLEVGLDLPRAGGAVLREFRTTVGRPTTTGNIPQSGDTEIRVGYVGGPTLYTDRFPSTYAYSGPVFADVDYSGLLADAIERRFRVPVAFSAGTRPTTVEVVRGGASVFRGTLFGSPPVADAGPDQVVECQGAGGAEVHLDGSGSSDPDGDLLSYAWTGVFGQTSGPTPTVFLPLGTTTTSLVVSDGVSSSAPDTMRTTVEDTQPPTLTVTLAPTTLWPPNHRLVRVDATVSVADACGDAAPTVVLASITSSQPDNGTGDGNTGGDIQEADIGTFDTSFLLRAERAGGDPRGRTYTVTYAAIDASGNRTETSATVTVPHNR